VTATLTPPRVVTALDEISRCLCAELTAVAPLCWCGIWHGDTVSWDYCGSECAGNACGMAWVRITSLFPYDTFGTPTLDLHCRLPIAYGIEVGCVRCMPTMGPNGELPPPDEVEESSLRMIADAEAMYRALRCCAAATLAIELYSPAGPLGGCAGGTWTGYLTMD